MAIDCAENDAVAAVTAIKALASKSLTTGPQSASPTTTTISHNPRPPLPQLDALENDLMGQVVELQKRKRIRGAPLSLEEMLNPIEEDCVGETGYEFPRGDEDIVAKVTEEAHGDDGEDSDDDEAENVAGEVTKPGEALEICARMERLCLEYASSDICVVDLQNHIRKLRAHFRRLDDQSRVQVGLEHFWTWSTQDSN